MTDLEGRLADEAPRAELDMRRLRSTLAARADAAHLLDIAYAVMDSPVGALTIFVTPRGVVKVAFADEPIDELLDELAGRVSPRIMAAGRPTDEARHQLESFLAGKRRGFELPLDWSLVRGFAVGVLRATAAVPFGATSTYRDVAVAAGSPRAARAAGNALGSNPIPIIIPCHRVLHASGGLGGYAGGLDRKRTLLRLEGALPAAHDAGGQGNRIAGTGRPPDMMFLRALPLIVLLAACATILPTPRATAADPSLHVQPNAIANGPGVSIADALRRPGENLLVNGTLLVDPDGTAWLCEALGESFPPSCGGARLRVVDLDVATGLPRLASGGGAQWSESTIQLLGTVRSG